MTDATAKFFDALVERGHEPRCSRRRRARCGSTSKTGRDGPLARRRCQGPRGLRRHLRADCVGPADKSLFENIAGGKTNGVAALLRGAMSIEGDVRLIVLFSGSFPGGRALEAASHRGSC